MCAVLVQSSFGSVVIYYDYIVIIICAESVSILYIYIYNMDGRSFHQLFLDDASLRKRLLLSMIQKNKNYI